VALQKEFSRNVCDFELLRAQKRLKFHQGEDNIYFVGGYTNGIGLHENCLNQSLKIAEAIQKDVLSPTSNNYPLFFSN
jgi:predicted NAD/FAD-binding protein